MMIEFERWRDEQKISGRSYKADARVWRAALEWVIRTGKDGNCGMCYTESVIEEELESQSAIPPDPQHGREPDKVKPLAQYLGEYLDQEKELDVICTDSWTIDSWCELLEQALDAYQSTENVTIKIERNA